MIDIIERPATDWDRHFIEQAQHSASKSKDNSTKCGAVIVTQDNDFVSMGFNGFPRGVDETIMSRWNTRPEKYEWVEHGERNAIFNAARIGVSTKGCKMYLNYRAECCSDCTRAIIQAGIVEVIGPNIPFPGLGHGKHYQAGIDVAGTNMIMFKESGINIVTAIDILE